MIDNDDLIKQLLSLISNVTNVEIRNSGSFILGRIEWNYNKEYKSSILIKFDAHLKIYKMLSKCKFNDTNAVGITVLANMAKGCDECINLWNDKILLVIYEKLSGIILSPKTKFTLQMWGAASLFVSNICYNKYLHFNVTGADLVISMLTFIYINSIQYLLIIDEEKYKLLTCLVTFLFRNIICCMNSIYENHYYMLPRLLYDLLKHNGYLLKESLKMTRYSCSSIIRIEALKFIDNIICDDIDDRLDKCLSEVLIANINQLIAPVDYKCESKEISLILSIISKIMDFEDFRYSVLNNEDILQYIYNGMVSSDDSLVKNATYCVLYVLSSYHNASIHALLFWKQGLILHGCSQLICQSNYDEDNTNNNIIIILELLFHFVKVYVLNIIPRNYISKRLNEYEWLISLIKSQLVIVDQHEINIVNIQLLEKCVNLSSVKKYEFILKYLISICQEKQKRFQDLSGIPS